jgi:hypothetical protein
MATISVLGRIVICHTQWIPCKRTPEVNRGLMSIYAIEHRMAN